jgi:glucans biosynthesis protein C
MSERFDSSPSTFKRGGARTLPAIAALTKNDYNEGPLLTGEAVMKTPQMIEAKQARLLYIDNLRAVIIVMVVLVHTAVTYSGIGSWYYVEKQALSIGSTMVFVSFLVLAQSFDMSFLFMLAGFFIPSSFDAKGPTRFIRERLYRLGIPLLIYIFLLHPLAVKLAYPDLDVMNYYIIGLKSLGFLGWTGPLWFILALIIFTGIYVILRTLLNCKISFATSEIDTIHVFVLTLIIAIPAFLIRIAMPVGASIANLQFPFFSGYIVMFTFGVIAKRLNLFDRIDYKTGKKWLICSLTFGYLFFLLIFVFGDAAKSTAKILGGLTWQSFAYALWESFSCVAITIGLIGIFRNRFNKQNWLQRLLSDNYFGVYVFHAPILIAISVSLAHLTIHPLLKFALVAPCAIIASYLVTFFSRKIHFIRSIFS